VTPNIWAVELLPPCWSWSWLC